MTEASAHCGLALGSEDAFCGNCGQPVAGEAALFAPGRRPISTRGEFEAASRSTTDSRVRVGDLAPQAGGGWAAGLSFVSHQNSGQSHTGTTCTAWRITVFLIPAGHHYLIVAPPAGYRSASRAC
jgi:hypothetical protein